jgi:HEXXH motif-containing protein
MSLSDLVPSLFSPAGETAGLVSFLANTYYHAVVERVLTALGSKNAAEFPQVLLANCEEDYLDWAPGVGWSLQLALAEGISANLACAQLAVLAAERGAAIDLELSALEGGKVFFAGVPIRTAKAISITADGCVAKLRSGDISHEFSKGESGWVELSGTVEMLPLQPGGCAYVTNGHCLDSEMVLATDPSWSGTITDAASQVRMAFDHLAKCSPDYLAWCRSVVRQVQVVGYRDSQTHSRSSPFRPGSIVMSLDQGVVMTAEMLVHEATHQYFFMLERIARVTEPEADSQGYYSPFMRRDRPLDRILVAYHALANMVKMHSVAANESADPAISAEHAKRIGTLSDAGHEMIATLTANRNLFTRDGYAFFAHSVGQIEAILSAPVSAALSK